MKNLYLKYILLSVAISSSLLFTACGKKSEPVNEVPENTQTEETTTSEEAEQDVSVYMDEDSAEFNFKQGKTTVQDIETVNSHESVDFYYTESQNAPIESENVTTESETAIIEEETIQQSETFETPDMEKADLDVVKKNLDRLLRKGIITQAEYDEMLKEQQELNELADENGVISGSDFDNYYTQKNNSDDSSSSGGGTQYQEKLPDYAVTKPSGEGDGADYVPFGQGDYSGLEKYSLN